MTVPRITRCDRPLVRVACKALALALVRHAGTLRILPDVLHDLVLAQGTPPEGLENPQALLGLLGRTGLEPVRPRSGRGWLIPLDRHTRNYLHFHAPDLCPAKDPGEPEDEPAVPGNDSAVSDDPPPPRQDDQAAPPVAAPESPLVCGDLPAADTSRPSGRAPALPSGGASGRPIQSPNHASGHAPVRVDTPAVLHRVAEALDVMYDTYPGCTRQAVLVAMREDLSDLAAGTADEYAPLRILAGAIALSD